MTMTRRNRPGGRRGAALVETAIVLPTTILLFLGVGTVGLGVYRNNQVAYLARQGARWASVHGPTYQTDQKAAAPTADDVITNAVVPRMAGLSRANLTGTLTWNTAATPASVTFRLDYQWTPELRWNPGVSPSTVTFTSTSTQPITY